MLKNQSESNIQPNKSALKTLLANGQKTKPLHDRQPIRADVPDIDQTLTHQWVAGSGIKPEIEGFIISDQHQCPPISNYE